MRSEDVDHDACVEPGQIEDADDRIGELRGDEVEPALVLDDVLCPPDILQCPLLV
jgi:hypothetical protein